MSSTDPSTEEPNAKRRRVASETSFQTITDLLPIDVLRHVFGKLLGPGHYRYVAGTCRVFREAYERAITDQHSNKTSYASAAASVPCADLCRREAGSIDEIAWAAARKGQIEVIEWAYSCGFNRCTRLFEEAGKYGQLEVFEWGDANGRRWENAFPFIVASAGNLKVLEWMRGHCAQRDIFRYCAVYAVEGGHVSVLEWMKRHGLPVECIQTCLREAAVRGHINVMDWLLDNGYSLQPIVVGVAARYGQITVLEWALEHQGGWSEKTCAIAALNGRLNALKWLRRNGCPWDGNVIHWAQEQSGNEVLEWARDNDCRGCTDL